MILFENQTNYNLDLKRLEKIAKKLTTKEIEFLLVDDEAIKEMNKLYRNKDYPTDVLSFPLSQMPNSPLGTIVISYDTAKRVSLELGHSKEDEICLLFIHGLLHLMGFDHEKDDGEMREEEKKLIEEIGLPKSLIVRSE